MVFIPSLCNGISFNSTTKEVTRMSGWWDWPEWWGWCEGWSGWPGVGQLRPWKTNVFTKCILTTKCAKTLNMYNVHMESYEVRLFCHCQNTLSLPWPALRKCCGWKKKEDSIENPRGLKKSCVIGRPLRDPGISRDFFKIPIPGFSKV